MVRIRRYLCGVSSRKVKAIVLHPIVGEGIIHIYNHLDYISRGVIVVILKVLHSLNTSFDVSLSHVVTTQLALTAGASVFRGLLADIDCRWDVIAQAVDDRTREELGEEPLKNSRFVIPKSRYETISTYLSPQPFFKEKYNDTELVHDKKIYQELIDAGTAYNLYYVIRTLLRVLKQKC